MELLQLYINKKLWYPGSGATAFLRGLIQNPGLMGTVY